MTNKYDIYTYPVNGKRRLDPGRASRNTFTAPLCVDVCDMGCKVYLSELVLIHSRALLASMEGNYITRKICALSLRNTPTLLTAKAAESWTGESKHLHCTSSM